MTNTSKTTYVFLSIRSLSKTDILSFMSTIPFLFLKKLIFIVVALQCCVIFYCTAKWISYMYIPSFFLDFLPFSLPFLFKHSFPHVHPQTIYYFLSYVFELYKKCYVDCSFLRTVHITLLAIIIQHFLPKQHNVFSQNFNIILHSWQTF